MFYLWVCMAAAFLEEAPNATVAWGNRQPETGRNAVQAWFHAWFTLSVETKPLAGLAATVGVDVACEFARLCTGCLLATYMPGDVDEPLLRRSDVFQWRSGGRGGASRGRCCARWASIRLPSCPWSLRCASVVSISFLLPPVTLVCFACKSLVPQ